MLLLPIGHEENTVRRIPIVTFGIMAICAVLFLFSGRTGLVAAADEELNAKAQAAIEYYITHPNLALDDEFEKLAYGEADAIEHEFEELSAAFGDVLMPGETHNAVNEQQELDRLTAAALESRDAHLLFRWGLIPDDISLSGLLMHMFLHAGWLHLIGNLLILYLAGPFVEDLWGRPLFAAFYLVAGLAAALLHVAFNTQSDVPLIGASGAIAGVMGAFLVHYHSTKIRFFYLVAFYIRGTFEAAAWVMLPMWFGEQLFFALVAGDSLSGVAYWAHVGGFGFGIVGALAARGSGLLERYVQPRLNERLEQTIVDRPGLDQALAALDAGNTKDAFGLFSDELRRDPGHTETAELYLDAATRLDRRKEALPLLLHAVQAQLRAGSDESALGLWQSLLEIDPALRAETGVLLRLAALQSRNGNPDTARETLRRALLCAGARPAPGLVFKIARLGREFDVAIARGALRALLAREEISIEDRAGAEQWLVELENPTPAPGPERVGEHSAALLHTPD